MKQAEKPTVKLIGEDGNVFNLLGICMRALDKADQPDQAEALTAEVFGARDYDDALRIMGKYVDIE